MGPVESISSRRLGILIRFKMSLVLVPTNIIGTPITRVSSAVQHDGFKSDSVIRHRWWSVSISIGKLGGSTPSEGPENLEPSLDALARGDEAETSLMSGQSLHEERLSWLDALCNRLHVQMTAARDPITHFEKDLFRKASAACATAMTGK
ncbi:hypothetical protein BDV35DRAFT_385301 [Aspergillus flavus]|uniref:Uncharacterized protein n=2 Tax=Aspergillus subgen. Circumdati TaxID=2720871 RepID=A0A5N6GGB8_ASPFL|nr:hypothetical protein Ao3042_01122 [Aspergillus oryzae 3.042]KAB8241028.1 hypothetical protein BDV35DRAFT_385301 [Aspergillus flavus]KDE77358.1 hypothetical protein AO1008_03565 [Aspergillus oryzae 100-8]|eukprot:EIT72731.1 hypothetical protein Ao3042_01122 [Aspergillus oryzae 3.042]